MNNLKKIILILIALGVAQIPTLHHDKLDGFVSNEHIDWTDATDDFKTSGTFHLTTAKTPASATDTGTAGEVAWDSSYIYVCVATDNWERAAISSWGIDTMIYENSDIMLYEDGNTMIYE